MVDYNCKFIGEEDVCKLYPSRICNRYSFGACVLLENSIISAKLRELTQGKTIKDICINLEINKEIIISFTDGTYLTLKSFNRDGEEFTSTIAPIFFKKNMKIVDLESYAYSKMRELDDGYE